MAEAVSGQPRNTQPRSTQTRDAQTRDAQTRDAQTQNTQPRNSLLWEAVPEVPTSLIELSLVTEAGGPTPRPVPLVATAERVDGAPAPQRCCRDLGIDELAIAELGITAEAGEITAVRGNRHGWLLGLGQRSGTDWRSAGAAVVPAANRLLAATAGTRTTQVELALPHVPDAEELTQLALGLVLGGYQFQVTAARSTDRVTAVELRLPAETDAEEFERLRDVLAEATQLAAATALCRDLGNAPSNLKDPEWLATTAASVSHGISGLTATIRDHEWLCEHRFGGVLAVGGGSARPPRLLELAWRPRGSRSGPHLVFVGKGITFDTGGISLKPAANMHTMRTDMAGGAAVIAAMRAIARMAVPLRVTALVPCAENQVSGSAYRPGDVVRHYGGTTSEVTNTDAEGRMVLADALSYAVARLQPDAVVDVATLTGAMKVALGTRTGGVFSTDDELAELLIASGAAVGEDLWQLPLLAAHAEEVTSELADVRQAPSGPGGVVAALFLRRFVGDVPWAHMDIAGPARAEHAYAEVTPLATGFAARTLVEFARRFG